MSVSIKDPETITVASGWLSQVLTSRPVVQALARQLVASHVETHMEMFLDAPEEYPNLKEVKDRLSTVPMEMEEHIEMLIEEFKQNLLREVIAVTVNTITVTLNEQGFEDAEVIVR